jgi:hypothetical protein
MLDFKDITWEAIGASRLKYDPERGRVKDY